MNSPFNDEIYTRSKSYSSPLLSVYGGEIINVWDKIEDNQLWDLHKNSDGVLATPGMISEAIFREICPPATDWSSTWLFSRTKSQEFCHLVMSCIYTASNLLFYVVGSKGRARMALSIISNDTLLSDKGAQFWKFLPFPPIKIMWPFLLIF